MGIRPASLSINSRQMPASLGVFGPGEMKSPWAVPSRFHPQWSDRFAPLALGAQFSQILDQVVGEGIVVVDYEDHIVFSAPGSFEVIIEEKKRLVNSGAKRFGVRQRAAALQMFPQGEPERVKWPARHKDKRASTSVLPVFTEEKMRGGKQREFLKAGLFSAAGLASLRLQKTGTALAAPRFPWPTETAGTPPPFHLGLVTYNLAVNWDIETIIKNCAKTGFEGAELRTTHKHGVEPSISSSRRAEVKKRFADSGVRLVSLGTTSNTSRRTLRRWKRTSKKRAAGASWRRTWGAWA